MHATVVASPQSVCSCSHVHGRGAGRLQTARSPMPAHHSPTPRGRRRNVEVQAFAGALDPGFGVSSAENLSQLASAVGVAIGAFWLCRELMVDSQAREESDGRPACPTCSGSGYQECSCKKWRDDGEGCATCRGSGKMVCKSCNGGGTGIPIPVKIVADRSKGFH